MSKIEKRLYFVRFPLQDQILFAKRLSTLVKSGVPLLRAIKILREQMRTRGLTRVFDILAEDIENGQYLHKSLGQFRHIFGDFAINLIGVGEMSGTLHQNLEYLSEELKKKQALRRKVIGALVYPVIIILATLGITSLLVFFVFPKILPIFQSLNFDLPWSTKALIWISSFFLDYWMWIIGAFILLIIAIILLMRVKAIRYWIHRVILTLPIFGRLSQSYQMANIFRTLGILLKTDVKIVESANITARTNLNLVYKHELEKIAKKITGGGRFSEHMNQKKRLFPPIASQMAAVGETSGNLSDTFLFIGNMYEEEVDEITKNLSTVLEPVLMVFMGLLVGFIAVSIITPIYEVTQHIQP